MQNSDYICARGSKRGHDSHDHSGQQDGCESEQVDAGVRAEIELDGKISSEAWSQAVRRPRNRERDRRLPRERRAKDFR